jgi:hypothetical protein
MARIGRTNGAREMLRQASLAQPADPADGWAVRLLTASVSLVERDGAGALAAIDAPNAPLTLEPYRLAMVADAGALVGRHDAALAAARRLSRDWQFGTPAQDEWMRGLLRVARVSESAGDTAAARTAYREFVERWKDADVFLVDLASAQRSLVRLGGNTVAATPRNRAGLP